METWNRINDLLYIVTDYAPMGDMNDYVNKLRAGNKQTHWMNMNALPRGCKRVQEEIFQYMQQISMAVSYYHHQRNQAHGQLRLSKILRFDKYTVKINHSVLPDQIEMNGKLRDISWERLQFMAPELVQIYEKGAK